jgi:sterol O-acyltransferase
MARLSATPNSSGNISRSSSLDKAPQLVGQLNAEGIARLQKDLSYRAPSLDPPRSLKMALEATTDSRRRISDTSSETASEEDYDALRHDPSAVVKGSRGGGFEEENGWMPSEPATNGKTYEELKPSTNSRPRPNRLRSM